MKRRKHKISKETQKRNEYRKRNYLMGREFNNNNYRFWTEEELSILNDSSGTDRELSKVLNRSVQAIQVKRCREYSWNK